MQNHRPSRPMQSRRRAPSPLPSPLQPRPSPSLLLLLAAATLLFSSSTSTPLFHPRKILDGAADRAHRRRRERRLRGDRRRRERRLHGDRRRRPGQDGQVDGDPFLVSQHIADELDGNGHFEANDEEGEGKAFPPTRTTDAQGRDPPLGDGAGRFVQPVDQA